MPPKSRKPSGKKSASATTATPSAKSSEPETPLLCDGCTDSLTKNEALNCSVCNVWLHCYCAGVPRRRYSDIASSYVCIPCSLNSHATVVSELKNEISCLKAEIVELKAALDLANKKLDSATASADSMQNSTRNIAENGWSTVVKRGGRQRQANANNGSTSSHHQTSKALLTASKGEQCGEQCASLNNAQKSISKMKVTGARRVWGTHWSSSPKAVSNTIKKFCGITPERVRRKCIKNDIGRVTRWWFIIHDSEEVLGNIESKWNQLKLQVAWELELCFAPRKDPNPACNEPNAPAAPENLDTHQSNPDMQSRSQVDKSPPTMQSQSQSDKLPQMSEKQTSPDNLENSANDSDNNSASLSQPDADDSHPFLDSQVPTSQDT